MFAGERDTVGVVGGVGNGGGGVAEGGHWGRARGGATLILGRGHARSTHAHEYRCSTSRVHFAPVTSDVQQLQYIKQ